MRILGGVLGRGRDPGSFLSQTQCSNYHYLPYQLVRSSREDGRFLHGSPSNTADRHLRLSIGIGGLVPGEKGARSAPVEPTSLLSLLKQYTAPEDLMPEATVGWGVRVQG